MRKNNEGNTPFGYSLVFGHPNYSVILMQQKADVIGCVHPLLPRTEDELLMIEIEKEKKKDWKWKKRKMLYL